MPNYTYNTNIPLSTNSPSTDQPNMQTNTNSINSILDVDMIGFNDNDGGYHSKVTLVDQVSSPPVAVTGTDIVYSATASGTIELYLQRPSGSAIQLTRGTPSASTSGYTWLPGGLLMQWGGVNGTGNQTFTYPIAFTSTVYSVQVTRRTGQTNALYVLQSPAPTTTACVIGSSTGTEINGYVLVIGI